MAEQPTDREKIERGEQARAVLDGPLFTDTIEELRQDLFSQIAKSEPEDIDKREACYFQLRALGAIRGTLRNKVTRGDRLNDKLEAKNKVTN